MKRLLSINFITIPFAILILVGFENYFSGNSLVSYEKIDNSIAPDTFQIKNIYSLGKAPTTFGYQDTIQIQYIQLVGSDRTIKVHVTVYNDSIGGTLKEESDYFVSKPVPCDTIIRHTLTNRGTKTDLIIVHCLPADAGVIADDTTNNSKTYCRFTTFAEFNPINPCNPIDSSFDLNGMTGNIVASFKNRGATPYYINKVDHCLLPSTNGGTYKIEVFADNGSGKPGTQLYLSPTLMVPIGSPVPTRVVHTLSSPLSISANSKFHVGYKRTSTIGLKVCAQIESPVRPNSFFYSFPDTSNTWYDFRDSSINKRLDISVIGYTSLINMNVIPEGFYSSGSNLMVKDTARAYLRNNFSPYAFIDTAKSFLDSTGFSRFYFARPVNGTPYYIVVRHRNSIETWSKSGGESFSSFALTYNFTTAASQSFGSNMIQIDNSPVRFGIFTGDSNQDGSVDVSDVVQVYNDASNFVSGYVVTDLNGDQFVDITDLIKCYNNNISFVSVVTP